ncbi:hypothetical protein VSS74_19330, partial [Conexibacter stalactiti]
MAETTDQKESGGSAGPIPPELQARLREGAELLRPHPHRGDLIAAGSVPLTVALLLINLRLDDSWGHGVFFVLMALAAGLVLGMGVLAPLEGERPRAYQVVLQLTGLALLFVALMRLAQVFGVDEPLDSAWTAFLILGIVSAVATWLARERRSEICTLVAGITGTFALLALVTWVFSPDGPTTTRWVLLLAALLLLVGALLLRDRHRQESVYLVDAAGVAVLVLALTFVTELLFGPLFGGFGGSEFSRASVAPGVLWKVVLLASGLGLVAYAGVDREAGPGYLGSVILLLFVVLVGIPGEDGPSLWFWPLVLLLIGAAMIAAGLRPRQPLPPEPDRGGPAPVVPAPVAPATGGPAAPAPAPAAPAGVPAAPATPPSRAAAPPPPPPSPARAAPAPPPPPPWMKAPVDESGEETAASDFVVEPSAPAAEPESPAPAAEEEPPAAAAEEEAPA